MTLGESLNFLFRKVSILLSSSSSSSCNTYGALTTCQALSWVLRVDTSPLSPHCKTCEGGALVALRGGGAPGEGAELAFGRGYLALVRPAAPSLGMGYLGDAKRDACLDLSEHSMTTICFRVCHPDEERGLVTVFGALVKI